MRLTVEVGHGHGGVVSGGLVIVNYSKNFD